MNCEVLQNQYRKYFSSAYLDEKLFNTYVCVKYNADFLFLVVAPYLDLFENINLG